MPRILVVEDNADLAAGLRHNLELEGYEVEVAEDGPTGLSLARNSDPDLIVLDLMLPGLDGFEVLETLRGERHRVPVLVLTARGEETDKVRAFRLDADQYLTKPFGLLEVLERIRGLLRRGERGTASGLSGRIRFGDVEVDAVARRVMRNGEEVSLTPKAFDLLLALVAREGEAISRQDLLRTVWGYPGAVVTRTVDSHVAELRRKLEEHPDDPQFIQTVWKIGYRFQR